MEKQIKENYLGHTIHPVSWPASMLKDFVLVACGSQQKRGELGALEPFFHANEQVLSDVSSLLHIVVALECMHEKFFSLARAYLSKISCSCTNVHDCFAAFYVQYTKEHPGVHLSEQVMNRIKSDCEKVQHAAKESLHKVVGAIVAALDVSPVLHEPTYKKSGYVNYYTKKGEFFSLDVQDEWKEKQKNVFKLLQDEQPEKVLDLGASLGWFSLLAARCGAQVIAIDISEAPINCLYTSVKENQYNVLPLCMSFELMQHQENFADAMKADVVLCLALIHHLVLLRKIPVEDVFKTLSQCTAKTLVVEFVDLEDKTIKDAFDSRTVYFESEEEYCQIVYHRDTYCKRFYTLDNIIRMGKTFFKQVEIIDSHPATRKLLIFRR